MEFNEKLQELRKSKNLTQEELASTLFVSRTAISKWESGRGYPSIESLKQISKTFSVSIDELLSGNELLSIAEDDKKQDNMHLCDLILGLLDLSVIVLFFLPFFGQKSGDSIQSVSLYQLTEISPYLKNLFFILIFSTFAFGILILALQNCRKHFWLKSKYIISIILNIAGLFLFILSNTPYAAIFILVFLFFKVIILRKK